MDRFAPQHDLQSAIRHVDGKAPEQGSQCAAALLPREELLKLSGAHRPQADANAELGPQQPRPCRGARSQHAITLGQQRALVRCEHIPTAGKLLDMHRHA